MARKIGLYSAGVKALLQSTAMHRAVQEATEKVAANVESQGITVGDRDGGKHEIDLPVLVEMTTTDRAKGCVILAHPAGAAVQAKHGALTKAAAAAGLTVTGGSRGDS